MMLTRDYFNKDVISANEHKLGKVVNLLVDIYNGEVDLVVFPSLVTKLVRDHAGNISGQITGAAISTLKQFIPGAELADIMVDQAGGYAGMRASGKVKTVMNVIQESHYNVPVYFASTTDNDQVILSLNYEECRKWCLNMKPTPESQVSFYNESHYSGPKRSIKVTLNTFAIQDVTCKDPLGNQAIIRDVMIDANSGRARGIIVNDLRIGTNRILDIGK